MSDGHLTEATPKEPERSERRVWVPLPPKSAAPDTVCPGGFWWWKKEYQYKFMCIYIKVHNISNKTSQHTQMALGTLLLALQTLKSANICFWRMKCTLGEQARSYTSIWKACHAPKDGWGMQLPSVISRTHNMRDTPQEQTGSHTQRGNKRHLWHSETRDTGRAGDACSTTLDRKNHFFELPAIKQQQRLRRRLSKTQPCSYSSSQRGCYFIPGWSTHWVEHNKPALHHLENPSCIPIIKSSQP